MHYYGIGVAEDRAEALRWFHLSAAQGHPSGLLKVDDWHEHAEGVAQDLAEAIRWYRRAQAVGSTEAASKLQRLGA